MTALFHFNDAFIDAASLGGPAGFAQVAEDALSAIEAEFSKALGPDYPLSWERNTLLIDLDEEQYGREFGVGGQPIQPKVRPVVFATIDRARRAAEKVWNADS